MKTLKKAKFSSNKYFEKGITHSQVNCFVGFQYFLQIEVVQIFSHGLETVSLEYGKLILGD